MKNLVVVLFCLLFSVSSYAELNHGYNEFNFIENSEIDSPEVLIVDENPPVNNGFFTQKANEIGKVLSHGVDLLGIKYKWGGMSEITGFDCSGYVKTVFEKSIGMVLPRTSFEMSRLGEKILSVQDLKPGDLVFFNTTSKAFSHVGIYMGDLNFMHAKGTGDYVTINNLTGNYWKKRFVGARRLVKN